MAASLAVTIVVNAYDEDPKILGEAIDSALAQSVQPLEVLLVDDGSPRDYSAVLAAHPTVRPIRQPNRGLSAARNKGLEEARGDLVVFLDGDDRLLPDAIAHNLRRFVDRPDAAMAYGGYRYIDPDGRPRFQVVQRPMSADAYATFLEGNCVGMHATVMYRRSVLREVGGFDETLPACEDYDVYLRIARRHEIAAGSELVAEYRQHDENMSNDTEMMLAAALRVLGKQATEIRDDPARQAAAARGAREWKEFYARTQLLAVLRGLSDRPRLGAAVSGLLRLALIAPVAILRVAMLEARERARARFRHVRFGSLRRTTPISRHFGYDRGNPVDRSYIEDFLSRHASDVRGRVLEVGDNSYTTRFGGTRVTLSEILHVDPAAPNVTYCTDLAEGDGIPDSAFDCIVLTQTLHLIFDVEKAARTLHRILKPGGVLLLTVPGVSSVDRGEWGGTWFWSFTQASLGRVLQKDFRESGVAIATYGNVLSATAFLYGLAGEELRPHEINACDPQIPVIVAARAVKSHDERRRQVEKDGRNLERDGKAGQAGV